MTDEQKLAALEAEKLVLEQKIKSRNVIAILEDDVNVLKSMEVGKGWRGWIRLEYKRESKYSFDNYAASIEGNPPMKLRLALAKVFRDFYGIEETQDDK